MDGGPERILDRPTLARSRRLDALVEGVRVDGLVARDLRLSGRTDEEGKRDAADNATMPPRTWSEQFRFGPKSWCYTAFGYYLTGHTLTDA